MTTLTKTKKVASTTNSKGFSSDEAEKYLIELILEGLIATRDGDKSGVEKSYKKIGEEYRVGNILKSDILNLANTPDIISKNKAMFELFPHIEKSTSGFTFADAIDLGHKVQFIGLSYLQENNQDVKAGFRNTHNVMDSAIKEIQAGTYDPAKLAILQALPDVSNWDHKLGASKYHLIYS